MTALRSYLNVHYRTVDWYNYAIGTPAEEWMKNEFVFKSRYSMVHLSDILRLISLHKFGGIYMDMDFIIQRNLDDLPPNFGSTQMEGDINNAILGFETKDVGHQIIDMMLRYIYFQHIIFIL